MQNSSHTDPNSQNDRKHVRHEFLLPIPVINSFSGASMGALVNVTVEGMMVMSNEALVSNHIYQVSLELPEPINSAETVELGVDCLWTRDDKDYGRHWSGFQIIDASPEAIAIIEILIKNYSENPD